MVEILAEVNGEEVVESFEGSTLEATIEFVAKHFCGELFFSQRPEVAKEIAKAVLARKGEVTDGTNFEGFTFTNAPNYYPVRIELIG